MISSTESFRFITKSRVLNLNRCKNLFLYNLTHKQEKKPPTFESTFGLENHRIKEMARSLFPGGVYIPKDQDIDTTFKATMDAIAGKQIIYDPLFIVKDLIANPDMLVPHPQGGYELWEIATSINTKKDFEIGIAFYKTVLSELGILIRSYKAVKINSDYVLESSLQVNDFFTELNYSEKILNSEITVHSLIAQIRKLKQDPSYTFESKICGSHKSCQIPENCFPDLNEGDIFTLREAGKTAQELYDSKVYNLKDIPPTVELTEKQRIQVESTKKNHPYIHKEHISQFLGRITYPVYYLDFETINPQIPIYKSTKPYQHIPFLFSLHRLSGKDDLEPEHFDYIEEGDGDPREPILERLERIIQPGGTILCFNDFFEKRCIKESVEVYKKYRDWWESIREHFLDAAIPFKNLDYYNPSQKGSASLKEILPSLTGSSHSHLDIQNGHSANLEYLRLLRYPTTNIDQKKITWDQLKEYCKMDSYALFLIHRELEKLIMNRSLI